MRLRPALDGAAPGVIVLVSDQVTKAWALEYWFDPPRLIEITSFFNLVPVWNTGVSFGLLSGYSDVMPWILAGLAALVSLALAGWLVMTDRRIVAIAVGLVIGGAVGNIIDRLQFRAVVDFIDLHVAGLHWPAFNIADAGITVGVVLLLLDSFFGADRRVGKD